MRLVPNARLRRTFLESGETPAEVAIRIGWYRETGMPDETRVMRALGLRQYYDKRTKKHYIRKGLQVKTAEQLAAALHLDPVDVGI